MLSIYYYLKLSIILVVTSVWLPACPPISLHLSINLSAMHNALMSTLASPRAVCSLAGNQNVDK